MEGTPDLQAPRSRPSLPTLTTKRDVRGTVRGWRSEGHLVGVAMTMGALHRGHLTLVEEAARVCDRVLATIYVNPLQFGPKEDFDSYPRDLFADLEALAACPCDAAFVPEDEEIFPDGAAALRTRIEVRELTERFCGANRPGHFTGVATEVAKQLLIVQPDIAFFGEKDYQQLCVIRRLVADLDIPVEIRGVPTVREPDGLALSSRNSYLSSRERAIAPLLHECLRSTAVAIRQPGAESETVLSNARESLREDGFDEVEYLALVDPETLAEQTAIPPGEARLLAAARLGRARLIDNLAVPAAR